MKYALALTAAMCLIGSQALAAKYFEFTFGNQDPASFVYEDLEAAAAKYCTRSGHKSLRERKMEADCKAYIIEETVKEIASTKLTAYHRSVIDGARPGSLAGKLAEDRG